MGSAVILLNFDGCPGCPIPVAISLRVGLKNQLTPDNSLEIQAEIL
jgi:hypothetical protein